MTTISGSAAAITGAASGIGRALALELAARGCDVAVADLERSGACVARRRRSSARISERCRCIASTSRQPAQIEEFAKAAIAQPSRAQHRRQQCGRRPVRSVPRNRPGADGVADEHQFLGRRARHARVPAAPARPAARRTSSTSPASSASSRRRTDRLLRGEIRGARLFGIAAARAADEQEPGAAVGRASRRRCDQHRQQRPHGRRRAPTISAAPRRSTASQQAAKTTPQDAALRIIRGIEKNEPRILIGSDARRLDLLQRFKPATYWATLARRIEKMNAARQIGEQRHGPCRPDTIETPTRSPTGMVPAASTGYVGSRCRTSCSDPCPTS